MEKYFELFNPTWKIKFKLKTYHTFSVESNFIRCNKGQPLHKRETHHPVMAANFDDTSYVNDSALFTLFQKDCAALAELNQIAYAE